MRSIAEHLFIYEQYHKRCVTQTLQAIALVLITYSLLVLFGWVHVRIPGFFDMPLSWLLTIFVLIYYFFLDITLAAALTVILILLNVLATLTSGNMPSRLSLQLFAYPFLIGVILQLAGHFFEEKRPTLAMGIKQLLIAPLYFIAELFFRLGYKSGLKQRLDDLTNLR